MLIFESESEWSPKDKNLWHVLTIFINKFFWHRLPTCFRSWIILFIQQKVVHTMLLLPTFPRWQSFHLGWVEKKRHSANSATLDSGLREDFQAPGFYPGALTTRSSWLSYWLLPQRVKIFLWSTWEPMTGWPWWWYNDIKQMRGLGFPDFSLSIVHCLLRGFPHSVVLCKIFHSPMPSYSTLAAILICCRFFE